MAIRNDKMGQSWLLPPSVSDLIPVDHICYLVIAIVNSIDVSELEEKYLFKPGNPAYPRRMLLRLLVQAAIDGLWSSRKIDKLAHENVGELPEGAKMSFDNGYFSGANLRYLETNGLDGYIPDSKQAQEMKGNKPKMSPFSKDSFDYDEETDQFLCPNGEILNRKGEYEYNGKPMYAYYGANCAEYEVP